MKPLSLIICFAGGLLMLPISAAASLPMVDGVGSYTHSQVMRHRTDTNAKPSRATSSRAYRKSLMPEYNRRAKKYGKAPADRWLAGKMQAFERQYRRVAPKR